MSWRMVGAGFFCILLGATSVFGQQPCFVSARPINNGTHIAIGDILAQFPEFQSKVDKGVTVTLEHLLRIDNKAHAEPKVFNFGCKVTFDLWDRRYTIVPTGFSLAKDTNSVSTLNALPAACQTAFLPVDVDVLNSEMEIFSSIDPVSAEQTEKTRTWLAARGIGTASQAILGRAVAAFIDLREEKAVRRRCRVKVEL